MASDTAIPKVTETDIDRDDLEQAAQELEIEDYESLDDQELFEAVGRQLGEIDDEDDAEDGDARKGDAEEGSKEGRSSDSGQSGGSTGDADRLLEDIRAELQEMTRDELREELRGLGLPVSGNKADLMERLEAVRVGQASADSNGQAAADTADPGEDTADPDEDTADEDDAQAEDRADQDEDEDDAEAEASADQDDDAADQGEDTADEVTEDRKQARDRGEYRVEEDQRDDVKPILDLELGPLALDVLGLDIHLNRVHAVLVANPGPPHALLGKLLSGLAVAADKAGLGSVTDTVTDGVEAVVDALPTPDTGIDDEDDEDDEGGNGDDRGVVRRLGSAATGAARSALNVVRHGKDAVGNAKDAAKDTITSGGKLSAAKEAKDAAGDVKDAATSAKNVATGGE